MKTFFSDIIPKLQRFSSKIDNLTLLTNQHWVLIDDLNVNKTIYIFRSNNDLLISQNGIVEKAKWEYLGNNSLLIDKKNESFLYKHGFFDENVLALKIDSKDEYAFLINENKYDGELNSIERIFEFLTKKYIEPEVNSEIKIRTKIETTSEPKKVLMPIKTDKGVLQIEQTHKSFVDICFGSNVFQDNLPAKDGKYKFDFMSFVHIKDGKVLKTTLF